MSDGSGVEHVMQAMEEGLPGCRDKTFTTCGKPKVPIESACFSSTHLTRQLNFLSGGGGSVRQPTAVLLGRCSEGDGEPGHVEDDPGAVGADARGAAKVHSAELGRARGFKPGRQRPPMLNELCTRRLS